MHHYWWFLLLSFVHSFGTIVPESGIFSYYVGTIVPEDWIFNYVGTIILEGGIFFYHVEMIVLGQKSYSAFKKYSTKNSFKYIQTRSCFENFVAKNTMVQSYFDLDILFGKYNFLLFDFFFCHVPIPLLFMWYLDF